ncbi:MAG: hypothetical protein J6A07_07750 [Firmicutes bacterium]|nr:hypothetical protein [Bacillota bacterium]
MTFNKIKYFFLLILCLSMLTPTYAVELPEGSVRGLPQNLIVMDTEGNSVSANGDYYVHVEDMVPGVLYTKDISVMNLRSDAVYRVYMSMAPNHTEGTIDLEGEVEVKLYLEDELIYTGDVNGNGTPNMAETPVDLGGIYNSGETRHLRAEFIWNMTKETEDHIMAVSNAGDTAFGAVDFDWIFFAQIREGEDTSDSTGGGRDKSSTSTHGKSSPLNPPEHTDPDKNNDNKTDAPADNDDKNENNENNDNNNNNNNNGGTPDDPNNGGTSDDGGFGEDNDDKERYDSSVFDKIADDLPFIPDDVKTGYHSRIVMYIKVLFVSLAAALLLLAGIIYKTVKLSKKNKEISNEKT